MENSIVTALRHKYGILETKSEYTEQEIKQAIESKADYFKFKINELGKLEIENRIVTAYEKHDTVFVKDRNICGHIGITTYRPMISSAIIDSKIDNDIYARINHQDYYTYYFFNKPHEYCVNFITDIITKLVASEIKRHESIIIELKSLIQ